MIDLLFPSKQLKASSKHWIESETISAIRSRDKLFKKIQETSLGDRQR